MTSIRGHLGGWLLRSRKFNGSDFENINLCRIFARALGYCAYDARHI